MRKPKPRRPRKPTAKPRKGPALHVAADTDVDAETRAAAERFLKGEPSPRPKQQARLFWTGRSQAVRLPKEFRFTGDAVLIRREGRKVILEPDTGWPDGFIEWLMTKPLPDDFEIPQDEPLEPEDIF